MGYINSINNIASLVAEGQTWLYRLG